MGDNCYIHNLNNLSGYVGVSGCVKFANKMLYVTSYKTIGQKNANYIVYSNVQKKGKHNDKLDKQL